MKEPSKDYFVTLYALVDRVYAEADNYTVSDLAQASGLAWDTVNNLVRRKTRFPRFLTIYRLAKAMGMGVSLRKVQKVKKLQIAKVA